MEPRNPVRVNEDENHKEAEELKEEEEEEETKEEETKEEEEEEPKEEKEAGAEEDEEDLAIRQQKLLIMQNHDLLKELDRLNELVPSFEEVLKATRGRTNPAILERKKKRPSIEQQILEGVIQESSEEEEEKAVFGVDSAVPREGKATRGKRKRTSSRPPVRKRSRRLLHPPGDLGEGEGEEEEEEATVEVEVEVEVGHGLVMDHEVVEVFPPESSAALVSPALVRSSSEQFPPPPPNESEETQYLGGEVEVAEPEAKETTVEKSDDLVRSPHSLDHLGGSPPFPDNDDNDGFSSDRDPQHSPEAALVLSFSGLKDLDSQGSLDLTPLEPSKEEKEKDATKNVPELPPGEDQEGHVTLVEATAKNVPELPPVELTALELAQLQELDSRREMPHRRTKQVARENLSILYKGNFFGYSVGEFIDMDAVMRQIDGTPPELRPARPEGESQLEWVSSEGKGKGKGKEAPQQPSQLDDDDDIFYDSEDDDKPLRPKRVEVEEPPRNPTPPAAGGLLAGAMQTALETSQLLSDIQEILGDDKEQPVASLPDRKAPLNLKLHRKGDQPPVIAAEEEAQEQAPLRTLKGKRRTIVNSDDDLDETAPKGDASEDEELGRKRTLHPQEESPKKRKKAEPRKKLPAVESEEEEEGEALLGDLEDHDFVEGYRQLEKGTARPPAFLRVHLRALKRLHARGALHTFSMKPKNIFVKGLRPNPVRYEDPDMRGIVESLTDPKIRSEARQRRRAKALARAQAAVVKRPKLLRIPNISTVVMAERNLRKTALAAQQQSGFKHQFSKEAVSRWPRTLVDLWCRRHKHSAMNDFFYHFTEPALRTSVSPAFSDLEKEIWLERYATYTAYQWPLASSWGFFSLALPHRTGQQCEAHHQSLLQSGDLPSAPPSSDDDERDMDATCFEEAQERWRVCWSDPLNRKVERMVNSWIRELYPGVDPGEATSRTIPATRTDKGALGKAKIQRPRKPAATPRAPVPVANSDPPSDDDDFQRPQPLPPRNKIQPQVHDRLPEPRRGEVLPAPGTSSAPAPVSLPQQQPPRPMAVRADRLQKARADEPMHQSASWLQPQQEDGPREDSVSWVDALDSMPVAPAAPTSTTTTTTRRPQERLRLPPPAPSSAQSSASLPSSSRPPVAKSPALVDLVSSDSGDEDLLPREKFVLSPSSSARPGPASSPSGPKDPVLKPREASTHSSKDETEAPGPPSLGPPPKAAPIRKNFSMQQKSQRLDKVIAAITLRLKKTKELAQYSKQKQPQGASRRVAAHPSPSLRIPLKRKAFLRVPDSQPLDRSTSPPKASPAPVKEDPKPPPSFKPKKILSDEEAMNEETQEGPDGEVNFDSLMNEPEETPPSPLLLPPGRGTRKSMPRRFYGTDVPSQQYRAPSPSPLDLSDDLPPPLSTTLLRGAKARHGGMARHSDDDDNDDDDFFLAATTNSRPGPSTMPEARPLVKSSQLISNHFHPSQLLSALRPEVWKVGLRATPDGFLGRGRLSALLARPLAVSSLPKWSTLTLFQGEVVIHSKELEGSTDGLIEVLFSHLRQLLKDLLSGNFTHRLKSFDDELSRFLFFLCEFTECYLPFCQGANIATAVNLLSANILQVLQSLGPLSSFSQSGGTSKVLSILLQLHAKFAECTFRMAHLRHNHLEHFLQGSSQSPVLPLLQKYVDDASSLCLSTRILDQELPLARRSQELISAPMLEHWIFLLHLVDAFPADDVSPVPSFWTLFNEGVLRWADTNLRDLPKQDTPDALLERAKILERAWVLLCEVSTFHQFDSSGFALAPKLLPSNWLLVEELLKRSVMKATQFFDPFALEVDSRIRQGFHQHIRSLIFRLCQFSTVWSPNLEVLFFVWDYLKELHLQDLDGDRREFPSFLQNFKGLGTVSFHSGDSSFHLFLRLLQLTLLSESPQDVPLDPRLAKAKEKKLNQALSKFYIHIPTSLKYLHPGQSLSGVGIPSLRNYAALILTLYCTVPKKAQLVSTVRRLVGLIDFDAIEDNVSRGLVFESLTILCLICQYNKISMGEVATSFTQLLTGLVARFDEEEKKRPLSGNWSSEERSKWSARQERLQQLIAVGLRSIQHIATSEMTATGFHCCEHSHFSPGWAAILKPAARFPDPLRKQTIDLIRTFLAKVTMVPEIPAPSLPTLAAIGNVAPVEDQNDSQDSYGELLNQDLDFDFEGFERQEPTPSPEDKLEREKKEAENKRLIISLADIVLKDIYALFSAKFRSTKGSTTSTTGPKGDDYRPGNDVFYAAIDCIAEMAEPCTLFKIRSWDYFFGTFGPSSHWMTHGESSESRQVTFRFISALLARSSGEVLQKFEKECINCWLLSNVDYAVTIQHTMTNSLLSAPKKLAIFENLPIQVLELVPLNQAAYKTSRITLLHTVLNNIGKSFHESSVRWNHEGPKLKAIRSQMLEYLSGIPLTMKKCLKELQAKGNATLLGKYQEFCYAVMGQLMATCARIIYDKDAQNALLPSLISEFFSTIQSDLAANYLIPHLSSLLQTLGQLDFRGDEYLRRTLFNTFQLHFEPICGHPARIQSEEQKLKAVVKALTDWSNLTFVTELGRVHEFRAFILGTYIRRYLTAHITRRDFSNTTVTSFKLLGLICKKLYAPHHLDAANAPARFQWFQDDLKVVFLPVMESVLACNTSIPTHFRIRAAALGYFVCFLDSLLRFQQLGMPANEEWARLVRVFIERILAETIISHSLIWNSPATAKACSKLRGSLSGLPSLPQIRNSFPYDSADFAAFNQKFPFHNAQNSRIPVLPEAVGQLDTLKLEMLGLASDIWISLLDNEALSFETSHLLHTVVGDVVSLSLCYYPHHPFVLALKQKLLQRLGKKGACFRALLAKPGELSLVNILI